MAGMLVLQSVFLVATGNVPIYFWIPCMIAAVSLMVGFIYFCCDVNFQDAGYFGMIAFVVAEFMAVVVGMIFLVAKRKRYRYW